MTEFDPKNQLDAIKLEIFKKIAGKLALGTYYPAKNGMPAEFVEDIPELGDFGVCSTAAEDIDDPHEIHVSWCRPERGRSAELWLTPVDIEVQYGTWDENHNHYTIRNRQPIHPEALMELHEALTTS